MAAGLFFYLFSAVAIASAVMVIARRNPVHSVLFLILAFFNGAGLFVLLGAEFLAMILVVVYVGAVAVLFLFVVMMLDVDFVELRQGMLNYLPVGATIGLILLGELGLVVGTWTLSPELLKAVTAPMPASGTLSNTEAIGLLLYTRYLFYFQTAGLVLLVAMVGAIVLTLRHKPGVQAPEHPAAGGARSGERHRDRHVGRARDLRGSGEMTIGARPLPHCRRDPVHHRRFRHLREPQERHRHPDVDRADAAGRQHQPCRLLGLPGRSRRARSSPCSC